MGFRPVFAKLMDTFGQMVFAQLMRAWWDTAVFVQIPRSAKNGLRPIYAEDVRKSSFSPIYAESMSENGFSPNLRGRKGKE